MRRLNALNAVHASSDNSIITVESNEFTERKLVSEEPNVITTETLEI